MTVWLIEDDHMQAGDIEEAVKRMLSGCRLDKIRTEQEFRQRFSEIAEGRGEAVVVLDVILRWADASPSMEPRPPEVKEGGADQAGFRCAKMLQQDARTKEMPIIFYSALPITEFPSDLADRLGTTAYYLEKGENHSELAQKIASTVKSFCGS
jgi:hypothetical protein